MIQFPSALWRAPVPDLLQRPGRNAALRDAAAPHPDCSIEFSSDVGQVGRDSGEQGADICPENRDGPDADYRNQADEQAVLDQSRAFLVPTETIDQLTHVIVL
jgi:hypothetical protein